MLQRLVVWSCLSAAAAQDAKEQAAVADASSGNPVRKVVTLLQEMQTQMQKDAKADLAAFKKMECYCKTHREEKSAAVEAAQKQIKQADDNIKAQIGAIAGLTKEIENLTADVAAAEDDIKKATKLRQKEAAAAAEAQKDMTETINALTTALDILGKVQAKLIQKQTAFLQISQTLAPFKSVLNSDLSDVLGKLNSAHALMGTQTKNFLQQAPAADGTNSAPAEPRDYSSGPVSPNAKKGGVAGVASYNSNSGAIYGLLGQMKVDFENQLDESIKTEAQKVKSFNKLIKEKQKIIASMKSQIVAKKKEIGVAKVELSNAKTLKEQTLMDLGADQKFLVEMETQCKDAVDGYGDRSKERGDEMKAVGEAVAFLTSDEARDIFHRGFGSTAFVQIRQQSSNKSNNKRDRLVATLSAAAKKTKSPTLALLAMSSKLDAFVKVKEALDKLKKELEEEQKLEFTTRDNCIEDLNDNKVGIVAKETELGDAEANVEELGGKIDTLKSEIEEREAKKAATNKMVAEATEDRMEENAAFKVTVDDQKLVVKVLKVALEKLAGFYGDLGLVQVGQKPPKQGTLAKQQGGNGALGLLHVIIADAEHVIKLSTEDETKAQANYEKTMADAKAELEALNNGLVSKTEQKGELESQKAEQSSIAKAAKESLMGLEKEKSALHGNCDFLLKNFEVRQSARTAEIESIMQAKQVLSGADFE